MTWITIWRLVGGRLFNLLCEFCGFLESFSHIFFNWAVANKVEFEHGLFNRDGVFGSHTESWELEVPQGNQWRDSASSLIRRSWYGHPMSSKEFVGNFYMNRLVWFLLSYSWDLLSFLWCLLLLRWCLFKTNSWHKLINIWLFKGVHGLSEF